MKIEIPQTLKAEHEELHEMLIKASALSGETGKAAKKVATLMNAHFIKEEEFALPPLGLLPDISSGKITDEMKKALPLIDRLKNELPAMLAQHKEIIAALNSLSENAKSEKQTEAFEFAEKLRLHAQTEEEIYYPTSLLIGEFIKSKMEIKKGKEEKMHMEHH